MGTARVSTRTGISAREAEVLSAVSEHLTNAEIAERLFISVRTVESHVASLLRKMEVSDRRSLARSAEEYLTPRPPQTWPAREVEVSLPTPLTSFVGRETEVAELAAALGESRMVTAVGPGGVGKTRLALRVANDARTAFPDGVWFVDLVSVTEPTAVPLAVAAALGVGESEGRSVEDVIVSWLGDRRALLVVDNCEHLLDAIGILLERLLTSSSNLTVLATSRARLLLPFEWAFPVPGLSFETTDGRPGDAVELFVNRARAGGSQIATDDLDRVAALCRGLDGMALAIELAAARLPSVGLDGLEAGLADRLPLLTGGSRVDDRHRSLRATLDWSYALLDDVEKAVLRRVSVFADAFSAASAAAVLAGWAPLIDDPVPAVLARLAEQSLLVTTPTSSGTGYRALETIRQYGEAQLELTGESAEVHSRHLAWCLAEGEQMLPTSATGPDSASWRARFDEVSVEARIALPRARYEPTQRETAYEVSLLLAGLSFTRGRPGESQRRYELAAELAPDPASSARALHLAAGAAEGRQFGNEALRLRAAAAGAALAADDRPGAAVELARAAELIRRGPGLIAVLPPEGEVERLLEQARPLAAGDLRAEARILIAEGFNHDETSTAVHEIAAQALELTRRAGDLLGESAALDLQTTIDIARGDLQAALASATRRTELLDPIECSAESALEFFDAFGMAAQCAAAAGDLRAAYQLAEGLCDLPFYREEDHLATSRLIVVDFLSGAWDEAVEFAELFSAGWERAGRPIAGNLRLAAYAAAAVHAMRGDEQERARWMTIVDRLRTPGRTLAMLHFGEFFDAGVLLHQGDAQGAVELLAADPETFVHDYDGTWRTWYAATWAEAAVLAGLPDAAERVERAAALTPDNPIASALVDRARLLQDGRTDELATVASRLKGLGSRYQWARTLVMTGADDRGENELAALGASPMPWPPRRS